MLPLKLLFKSKNFFDETKKAAIAVFISLAPLPYKIPSLTRGVNGSESHSFSSPGGTTSVCPAKQTFGPLPPVKHA